MLICYYFAFELASNSIQSDDNLHSIDRSKKRALIDRSSAIHCLAQPPIEKAALSVFPSSICVINLPFLFQCFSVLEAGFLQPQIGRVATMAQQFCYIARARSHEPMQFESPARSQEINHGRGLLSLQC